MGRDNEQAAKDAMMKRADELVKNGNVILFNAPPFKDYPDLFKGRVIKREVGDALAFKEVTQLPFTTNNAVIALSNTFAVGVDVKFESGATVLVCGPINYNRDQLF